MKKSALALTAALLFSQAVSADGAKWEESFPGNGIGFYAEQSGVTVTPPPTPENYPRFAELEKDQIPKYTEWYIAWLDIVGVGMNLTADGAADEKRSITFDLVLAPVLNELASEKCAIREIRESDTIESMVLDAFECLKEQKEAE